MKKVIVASCVMLFGVGAADGRGQDAGIGDPDAPIVLRPADMPAGTGNLRYRHGPPSGYSDTQDCSAECNVIDFEGLLNNQVIGTITGVPNVTFGPSWLSLVDADAGGNGNFANEPSASTTAYFLTPVDPINFSAGVGFVEVFYTAASVSTPVTLTAYDGPDGTGNIVALDVGPTIGTSFDGAPCSGDPNGDYCLWDALTLTSQSNDIRSLVLSGAVANQFGFDDMTFCITGDTDQDGLLDTWETCGIDADMDGIIDLDLAALGADPNVRDVFVEIDAMQGRAPSQAVLARVVAAFKDQGIALHSLLDETNIPVAPWPAGFADFDTVKAARFGTAAERASPNWAAIRKAKALSFRYCVFADQYDGGGSSGLAEIGGDDFMVTLGHPSWPVPGGTADEQAGTYMHELGHTLGLRHGGADDLNNKPNYHSVMNYTWQFPTNATSTLWTLVYSTKAYGTLDENALDEASGIGGQIGQLVPVGPPPFKLVPETGPVDWNRDGDSTDVSVISDITHLGAGVGPTPGQVLTSHHDWPALDLNFRDSPDFGSGVHIFTSAQSEIDADTYLAIKDEAPSGRWMVQLRQKATGSIDAEQEADSLWYFVPEGAEWKITAHRKGGKFQPAFSLNAPNADVLVTEEQSIDGPKAATATATVSEAGLYRLTLHASEGESTGDYNVKTKVKYPAKFAQDVPVPQSGVEFALPGMVPGMTLKLLQVKALKAKGDHAEVDGVASALEPQIALYSPSGQVLDLESILTTSKNGKVVTLKNLTVTEVGVYRLVISGVDESVGWARVKAVRKIDTIKGVSFEPADGDL